MTHISNTIKLIRTYTIFDLSHKAEKCMLFFSFFHSAMYFTGSPQLLSDYFQCGYSTCFIILRY